MHMVESGCHMIPKESMNFRSEDFVGQVSRLGHSCSMGVRSTKLSSKIIPKYLVLLHFQLTRPDFNTKSSMDESCPCQKGMMHKCLYTSKSVGVAWGTLASLAQRLATCEQMCMLLSFVSPWQALPKGFLHVFEKVLLHVSPWRPCPKVCCM